MQSRLFSKLEVSHPRAMNRASHVQSKINSGISFQNFEIKTELKHVKSALSVYSLAKSWETLRCS